MRLWRDYFRLSAWFPGLSLWGLMMSCIAALLEGAALTFLMPVLERQLGGSVSSALPWLGWLLEKPESIVPVALAMFVSLGILAAASRFASQVLLLRLRTLIEQRARERMGHALLHMTWPAFLRLKLGEVLKAQLGDGAQLALGTQTFLQGLGAALAACAYVATALLISVRMTAYALVFGAAGALLYWIGSGWARRHSDRLSAIASSIGVKTSEMITGLKYIRSTGLGREAGSHLSVLYRDWGRALFFSQLYGMGNRLAFEVAAIVFITAFLALSLVWAGGQISAVLIFLAVFYRLSPRLLAMQDAFFQASTFRSWVESWQQRIEAIEAQQEAEAGSRAPSLAKAISLKGVSYRYPQSNTNALDAVDLEIAAGETIAIVGNSGGGKSTLLDLLTGLITPTRGEIVADGSRLDEYDPLAWRRRIGVVMHETPLLHDTVEANIVWGADHVDGPFVRDCAQMANALEFISALPEGFATVIGERGGRLSSGQKQRIVLARAIYRRPALMLLDEPTSALDSESEAAVQSALETLKGKCTMVIVTHRLKTARFADRVIVLDRGRIIEDGGWDELVGRPGSRLQELVALQTIQ